MTNFDHKGTPIELLSNGKFQTTINGRKVTGPSLEGLKKQIDNASKNQFKVFKAIAWNWGELKEATIVGVKAPRKNAWRASSEFIDSDGRTHSEVIEDTPENRKAIADWQAYKEETRRIDKERKAVSDQLDEAIVRLKANDFAPKKPSNGDGSSH